MFTGLIESVGHVGAVTASPTGMRITIETPLAADVQLGESVAVNGVCLTATSANVTGFQADIGPETARITTLGQLRPGDKVNLERSMRADTRFGGHFVQGHVDAVGELSSIRIDGDSHWLAIRYPFELASLIVRKGSIAVDGISLTVADLQDSSFEVMIIPFTWAHTNLSSLAAGARVNLECDMVGKYVARAVELARATPGSPQV